MIVTITWIVAIISALSMLSCLVWLLWLRARNTLKAASNASQQISKVMAKMPTPEQLLEQETVSLPRSTDAFGVDGRTQELREQRETLKHTRRTRKDQARAATVARWNAVFK